MSDDIVQAFEMTEVFDEFATLRFKMLAFWTKWKDCGFNTDTVEKMADVVDRMEELADLLEGDLT